jgi:hypothetical protein
VFRYSQMTKLCCRAKKSKSVFRFGVYEDDEPRLATVRVSALPGDFFRTRNVSVVRRRLGLRRSGRPDDRRFVFARDPAFAHECEACLMNVCIRAIESGVRITKTVDADGCLDADELPVPRGTPCGSNVLCGMGMCDGIGSCIEAPVCIDEKADVRSLAIGLIAVAAFLVAACIGVAGYFYFSGRTHRSRASASRSNEREPETTHPKGRASQKHE